MSAGDHVSKAQSGRYQFHHQDDYDYSYYHVYKGEHRVGRLEVSHEGDNEDSWGTGDDFIRPHTIRFLQVAKGHAAAGMTALGIAQNNARGEGGRLVPDNDLSSDSSRLVRNLQGRGLVTATRPSGVTNAVAHLIPGDPVPVSHRPGERLRTTEVDAGRETIRGMLKQGRPKRPKL